LPAETARRHRSRQYRRLLQPNALDDPEAEFDVALVLLGPTGQTYEVGRLPGPYPLSQDVQDVSADGRTAVVASSGDEATSYSLLDLPTMTMASISTSPAAWRVRFGSDDRSLLVEERFTTPEPSGAWLVERIMLSRAALDGTDSQRLVDLPLTSEQQEIGSYFSAVELRSGEFATTEVGSRSNAVKVRVNAPSRSSCPTACRRRSGHPMTTSRAT
jgi:hypothetical protein